MSVAARAPSGLGSRFRFSIPPAKLYFWCFSLAWLAFLGWEVATESQDILAHAAALAPWAIVLTIVNLLPVTIWQPANFTPDIPISVAGMLVLSPLHIGVVTLLATFDPREFMGRIHFAKTVFNRSQISLAVFFGSRIAHAVVGSPAPSAFILILAFLSLTAMSAINYALTGIGVSLEHGYSVSGALNRMRIGRISDYLLTLGSWGVLGAMLAALYDQIGPLALLAFLGPTLLGRQTLARSQTSIDTARAYRSREAALSEISNQIYQERMDERRMIAADLHDEVLQPLFKVSLMGHVLKSDLASGQLLELDQDLPELLTAAELASTSLRELIGDLRRSRIGPAGLASAIRLLARTAGRNSTATIDMAVQQIGTDEDRELVIYQFLKEALTNAVTHSYANHVWVNLDQDEKEVRASVRDDGIGFDVLAQREDHYGIQIMRERVQSAGGQMYLDSKPGGGTLITAHFPTRD
jgi:signal transduction histidine kinase